MNHLKTLFLLTMLVNLVGCSTIGPTLIIETKEPTDDFIVLCKKTKTHLIAHNASRYTVIDNVILAKSGEEISCGLMLFGSKGRATVLHPNLRRSKKNSYTKDGVLHVFMKKSKLDVLDEKQAMFEAGYWKEHENPGEKYAQSLTTCGFPHLYFNYYSEVKKVDVEYFKNLYHKSELECAKRTYAVNKEHRPKLSRRLPTPKQRMEHLWGEKNMSQYY